MDRLETMGLVDRRVISTTPPATRYSATAVSRELRPILDGLASWGAAHTRTTPEADRTA
ncbi:MAG: helix-turn-helix transcriptional regulator [Candidatus Dormibacteraeota bacterium]|uniref:Helix-turn-helix transcriptional regulator n=1 Tax=Candidatus Amunia macphersoniae TaxID=3127014 RepID=A0A934KQN2_9BACT|nr:helix-turn-helix transcriptional regulator [Candidatus Dormibacteraeota bacterium]